MYSMSVNVESIAARERKNGNTELADVLDGLATAIEKLRAENERLRATLKPFADAVYNDNGDVTYSPMHGTDDYWRAYCVLRAYEQKADK